MPESEEDTIKRSGRWLLFIAVLLLAGCAADVGDVDRTQPNRVSKSIFLPDAATGQEKVWYYRATITDLPMTARFAFIGEQSKVEKIVWDVQEDFLVAYRAYEFITGSEQYASRPGNRYRGAPIAAFPILSHFDVRREYNPSTGEQTNVISENTTDRPWYQREFMRVDWADNRIADLSLPTAEVKAQAMYYVQANDPDSKDHPVLTDDYLDITTKLMIQPETVKIPGHGAVPRCYLWSELTNDCVGQPVKVRHSFLRAGDDREEYEPLPHDAKAFAKFGYFATKRYVYDRERGLLEGEVEQYAERFNLWGKSRALVDGQWTPLRYEDRSLRPIAFYVNDQFPRTDSGDDVSLIESAQAVADDWDTAFRDTVTKLRQTGAADGRFSHTRVNRMLFLCRNNPVTDDDTNLAADPDLAQFDLLDASGAVVGTSVPFPNETRPQNKICGPKGLNPQIGDLRYNFQYWVPAPQAASPLGYGPHAADPENGRVLEANAFIYGAAMETYVSMVADMVALLTDDLTTDQLVDGTYLRTLLQERLGKVPDTYSPQQLREAAQSHRVAAIATDLARRVSRGELQQDYVSANLKALDQGQSAASTLTDEIARAFTGRSLGELSDDDRANLAPSALASPALVAFERDRIRRLSEANITAAEFYDDSLLARALTMKAQYGSLEPRERFRAIRRDLLREMYVASSLHEFGHTLGLRHNFAASADALNYITDGHPSLGYLDALLQPPVDETVGRELDPKNYWSLRPWMQWSSVQAAHAQHPLQPTYNYPFDRAMLERYPLREMQYSSIMDYSARPNGDLFGLGKYDLAAIHFGYGQLVDIFDPTVLGYPADSLPDGLAARLRAGETHYTYLPYLFAGTTNPDELQRGIDLMTKGRRTIRSSDLLERIRTQGAAAPVEVPYLFCSDEYADGSSVCYRFDEGPDMYEMVQGLQERYESNYWFTSFKRGRVNFALGGFLGNYVNQISSRYFLVLSNQYKHFVNDELYTRMMQRHQKCVLSASDAHEVDHYMSEVCGLDQWAATLSTLDFFSRVLARPDVGDYGLNPSTGAYELDFKLPEDSSEPTTKTFKVEVGTGRFAETRYDHDQYGYDFFFKPVIIGSWIDKVLAVQALGDPYTNFMGIDSGSDMLNYVINFSLLFSAEMNDLVGGFVTRDTQSYACRVDATTGKLLTPLSRAAQEAATPLPVLDPSERYSAQLLSAMDALALFTQATNDPGLANSMRINVAGLGESADVPAGIKGDPTRYVELTDPETARTYWAVRYEPHDYEGAPIKVTPLGFRLLSSVKQRVTDGTTGKVDPYQLRIELRYVDILRGLVHDVEYLDQR